MRSMWAADSMRHPCHVSAFLRSPLPPPSSGFRDLHWREACDVLGLERGRGRIVYMRQLLVLFLLAATGCDLSKVTPPKITIPPIPVVDVLKLPLPKTA